jgi:hypothetical protein
VDEKDSILVGGIPTPLKSMKFSWDDYSQYMEKCSKPPTSVWFNVYGTMVVQGGIP